MKTVYYTATSLDGYIADPDHSLDWLFQFEAEAEGDFPDFFNDLGVVVMGSSTYEWVLANHVHADPDEPKPWPFEAATWVFTTRSLSGVPGADIRFASGDVSEVFPDIRDAAAGKAIWISGGGALAAQFHERGLLDEVIVTIAPVMLGAGAPLFAGRIVTPPLRVRAVTPKASGLTEMRFEVQRGEGGNPTLPKGT